jgi:hypothetical protein
VEEDEDGEDEETEENDENEEVNSSLDPELFVSSRTRNSKRVRR